MAFSRLGKTHIASAIAGHHAGMPDCGPLRDKVTPKQTEALALLERAAIDLPMLGKLLENSPPKLENPGQRFDLLTRMLLSCLVDAGRLDTAGREAVQASLNAQSRLDILLSHLGRLSSGSPEGVVKTARGEVLEDCLRAASRADQILSPSVPTGGGKTICSCGPLGSNREALT